MAGYIGNNPSDSSVRIARQIYTTSGITSDFTFTSGYDPGYIDIYVNGERQTEGTNFSASDGQTFTIMNGGVSTGSTVEASAYKTFNVATVTLGEVTDVDDLVITGQLTSGSIIVGSAVTANLSGLNVSGVVTATSFSGDGSALTGLASTDIINAEQVNVSGSTTTGIATVSTSIVVGSAVTVTATAININPTVTTTIGDSGNVDFNDDAKARFGTGNDLSIYHSGSHSFINDSGTGNLKILSSQVDILNPASNETIATFAENGAVSLYYDNTKRLETIAIGGKVTGELQVTSGIQATGIVTATGTVISGVVTSISDGNSGVVLHRTFGGDVSSATNTPQLDFTLTDTATSNQSVAKISPQAFAGTGDAFKGNLRFFTANDAGTSTERLRIDSSGRVSISSAAYAGGETAPELYVKGTSGRQVKIHNPNSGTTSLQLSNATTGEGDDEGFQLAQLSSGDFYFDQTLAAKDIVFRTKPSGSSIAIALTLDSSQNATFGGSVTDSKGNVRSIPANIQSSGYVAVASDAGKVIFISTGGVTINTGVFSSGDALTIVNNSGSDQTITKGGGMTIHNSADATNANRTLASRGMATIWFYADSNAYISGAGLS